TGLLRQLVADQNKRLNALQKQLQQSLKLQQTQQEHFQQALQLLAVRHGPGASSCGCASGGPSTNCWTVANGKKSIATQTSIVEGPESKTVLLGEHRSVGCGTEEQGKQVAVVDNPSNEQFYDNIMARVADFLHKSGIAPVKDQMVPPGDDSKKKKAKNKKKRSKQVEVSRQPEDAALEATLRRLRDCGASFVDMDDLRREAVAAIRNGPVHPGYPNAFAKPEFG
ncbi:unnamed protein product, partial [Notodromas monacha]